jgi:DNA-binding PadR family transcriptional regulator
MNFPSNVERDLIILEQIEQDPDTSQAALASQLEVAVGTVNWHLKRLIEKGYVKVSRLERKKLKYIITPEGLLFRARLTVDYIQNSFNLYRLVRQRANHALDQIKALGYHSVQVKGNDEVAEICRLTCMEQGVTIVNDGASPVLKMVGLKVILETQEKPKNDK